MINESSPCNQLLGVCLIEFDFIANYDRDELDVPSRTEAAASCLAFLILFVSPLVPPVSLF